LSDVIQPCTFSVENRNNGIVANDEKIDDFRGEKKDKVRGKSSFLIFGCSESLASAREISLE